MFTHKCFIRKINQDIIEKLRMIGYEVVKPLITTSELKKVILCDNGFCYEYGFYPSDAIDCGENEDLFFAIASLQDDTDSDQWFVYPENDTWFICDYYDIDAERNAPSTRNSCQAAWFYKSHKASLEELIEKFKNK